MEQGTHEELLDKAGLYQRLYEIQFRGKERTDLEGIADKVRMKNLGISK